VHEYVSYYLTIMDNQAKLPQIAFMEKAFRGDKTNKGFYALGLFFENTAVIESQ